uniref:Uncharacterized protein n=1 Tax=Triticum urartu TaxID=4572 RepID=A0A8R7U0N4_TRIUA
MHMPLRPFLLVVSDAKPRTHKSLPLFLYATVIHTALNHRKQAHKAAEATSPKESVRSCQFIQLFTLNYVLHCNLQATLLQQKRIG